MQTVWDFTIASYVFSDCYSFNQKQSKSNPVRLASPQFVLALRPIPGRKSVDGPSKCISKMRNKKFS